MSRRPTLEARGTRQGESLISLRLGLKGDEAEGTFPATVCGGDGADRPTPMATGMCADFCQNSLHQPLDKTFSIDVNNPNLLTRGSGISVLPQFWCVGLRLGTRHRSQATCLTRFRNNWNPARPYICRLSNFRRLTCPSTWPLFHGSVRRLPPLQIYLARWPPQISEALPPLISWCAKPPPQRTLLFSAHHSNKRRRQAQWFTPQCITLQPFHACAFLGFFQALSPNKLER